MRRELTAMADEMRSAGCEYWADLTEGGFSVNRGAERLMFWPESEWDESVLAVCKTLLYGRYMADRWLEQK